VANASRVTLTGVLTEYKPELAEGFFHTASGWVIFMVALAILIGLHQILNRGYRWLNGRRCRISDLQVCAGDPLRGPT
jgi:hypothetical protein